MGLLNMYRYIFHPFAPYFFFMLVQSECDLAFYYLKDSETAGEAV